MNAKQRLLLIAATLAVVAVSVCIATAGWYFSVRRANEISQGVQMLASLDHGQQDPISLLRVVNYLQSLGRTRALTTLRTFAKNHPLDDMRGDTEIFNIDNLIPVLFEHPGELARYPVSATAGSGGQLSRRERYKVTADYWADYVAVLEVDDIPFYTDWQPAEFFGFRAGHEYLIGWAADVGKFREQPLHPTDNPFESVDLLVEEYLETLKIKNPEIALGALDKEALELTICVRNQVYQMVKDVVPNFEPPTEWAKRTVDGVFLEDEKWDELMAACEAVNMRWDASQQKYVGSGI